MGRTQLPKPFSHACFPASGPAPSQPACPFPRPPERGTGTAPGADGEGGSALPSAGTAGPLRPPRPRRHGGRGLRRACPHPPPPGPLHPSLPAPLTAAERRSWLGSMAAARRGPPPPPSPAVGPGAVVGAAPGKRGRGGAGPHRGLPSSLRPSLRRGRAARGSGARGRASRHGRGGESRTSCLGVRGVCLPGNPVSGPGCRGLRLWEGRTVPQGLRGASVCPSLSSARLAPASSPALSGRAVPVVGTRA